MGKGVGTLFPIFLLLVTMLAVANIVTDNRFIESGYSVTNHFHLNTFYILKHKINISNHRIIISSHEIYISWFEI